MFDRIRTLLTLDPEPDRYLVERYLNPYVAAPIRTETGRYARWEQALNTIDAGHKYLVTDTITDDQWEGQRWGVRVILNPINYLRRAAIDEAETLLRTSAA